MWLKNVLLVLCLIVIVSTSTASYIASCQGATLTPEASREGSVCIRVGDRTLGTGFFIGDSYVATSWRVISDKSSKWKPLENLIVECPDGQIISADCIAVPTEAYPEPDYYNFTILELEEQPIGDIQVYEISDGNELPRIGSIVYFSGYAFGIPMMLTNRGMLSGVDTTNIDMICVQASVNKGCYGAALMNDSKIVVGILSGYTGLNSNSITDEPDEGVSESARIMDEESGNQGRHHIAGTGFALSTKYLNEYCDLHGIVL